MCAKFNSLFTDHVERADTRKMLKQKRKSSQSQESGGRRKTRRKGEATSNPAEAVDWDGFSIPVVPEEKGATVEVPVESKQQVTDASSEKAKLYRPPTHDELSALKETQNLFKSNLMKLQVRQTTNTHTSRASCVSVQ